MKQRKIKRVSWRRAVSMLLAAVMVLTAAPQAGLTAFASESGGGGKIAEDSVAADAEMQALSAEDSDPETDGTDDSAGDNDGTGDGAVDNGGTGDGAVDNGGTGDGAVDNGGTEDGAGDNDGADDGAGDNDGTGDGAGDNDGTEDGAGNDDGPSENTGDGEEAGNTENPEQGEEPDAAEDTGSDEAEASVSENQLNVKVMAEGEQEEQADEPLFEVKDEEGQGTGAKRLVICADRIEGTTAQVETKIKDILKERAGDDQRFVCVQLDIKDSGAAGRVIKKDILNAAAALLDKDHRDEEGNPNYWIDYNFIGDGGNRLFSLSKPDDATADIKADVAVTGVTGQGVKLKVPAVNFPAENVSLRLDGSESWGKIFGENLAGAGSEDGEWEYSRYNLFTLASGKPAAHADEGNHNVWCGKDENEIYLHIDDVRRLKANTDYLMAPVADAESMNAGETKELTVPAGAANVAWKSFTPDIASISTTNGKTQLTAWDGGEALYGVTYKEGSNAKAKFYRMKVDRGLFGMEFLEENITLKPGEWTGLQLNSYPSDFGIDPNDTNQIAWKITESTPTAGSGPVIELRKRYEYDNEGNPTPEDSDPCDIIAVHPGTATVMATYQENEGTPITAECKITVEAVLDQNTVDEERAKNIDDKIYAVSGCDTKLKDVTLPDGWKWVNEELDLAPYAGSEGHDFPVIYTKDGVSWQGSIWVRMINVREIVMTSLQEAENDSEDPEANPRMEWVDWVPESVTEGDDVTLGFRYELDNIRWDKEANADDADEIAAVQAKLAAKYTTVEWSAPKNEKLVKVSGQEGQKYTAAIVGKNKKAEKKTFTVSVKEGKKVLWKTSRTLTVLPKDAELFDWGLIEESTDGDALYEDMEYDSGDKAVSITLKVKLPKQEYDEWGLTYTSLDNSILQLRKPTVTAGSVKGESGEDIDAAIVKIPCTQKSTGRVWIQVTANDALKSSFKFRLNLEDKRPTILGAATKTINKAAADRSVPIFVSTSESFPLVEENQLPAVSIEEVKSGKNDASSCFELKDIQELSGAEAAALIDENPDQGESSPPETYIGVYRMNLALKGAELSGLKAGNYTVKLKFKTWAVWNENKQEEQSVSLTVKVTDVKPKVTFKQTKKVNLFYTKDKGAGTLQINTAENVTGVTLKDYTDKNPNKNAACHYAVEQKTVDGQTVYQIVRKAGVSAFDEKLKKGTLEYTVEGYAGTFSTAFTVATESKAPTIVLSVKSDMLYPELGYTDSWISMSDKATGEPIAPVEATYYEGKGAKRKDTKLTIGEFKEGDENADNEQRGQEKEVTGGSSKNKYGLFVTNDGNIVSRLRQDDSYKKNADTMNLEIREANWTKPVAVSYKLQVESNSKAKPKLVLGKATLTLNKNEDVWRGQQERTTLRLKGSNSFVMQDGGGDYWVSITGQDDKSKAELKGKESSLVVQYWNDRGVVIARFNNNKIAPGNYKFRIDAWKNDTGVYASTVLTVKIVDKTVKQSLKVTQKGSIDVLNREGTSITFAPKISNLTGTVEDGWLAGKDADMFENWFEDGKLIVKARGGSRYSTKITYEVHTVFRVQTEDWRGYEISSASDSTAKPFKIKVKQGKPKLTAAAVDGSTIYRQRDNRVNIRIEAMLGKQEVEIEDAWLLNYWDDIHLEDTEYSYEEDGTEMVRYNPETKSVRIALNDAWQANEFRKNGTYKVKLAVRYCDRAGDVKTAEVTCPIIIR